MPSKSEGSSKTVKTVKAAPNETDSKYWDLSNLRDDVSENNLSDAMEDHLEEYEENITRPTEKILQSLGEHADNCCFNLSLELVNALLDDTVEPQTSTPKRQSAITPTNNHSDSGKSGRTPELQ